MGCVISFQDFSELFGKHRALLLPSAASLSFFFFFEEFLPARFGAIPLENLGCLEGDKHLEAGVCEEGRIHLIPAFPRQQSHGGSEPAHICTWEMKF